MGSNKMLQVALGRSDADEYRPHLSSISAQLAGHVGLFFTKLPQEEVRGGSGCRRLGCLASAKCRDLYHDL
jgi:hypothetical protein